MRIHLLNFVEFFTERIPKPVQILLNCIRIWIHFLTIFFGVLLLFNLRLHRYESLNFFPRHINYDIFNHQIKLTDPAQNKDCF